MPKLLIFVPTERVIVSREGPFSLITVLEALNLSIPVEEYDNLPDDAVMPITWFIVTRWIREAGDEEADQWEQRLQVILSNGRVPTDVTTLFQIPSDGVRNIAEINGIAIKPAGLMDVSVSLRRSGEDDTAWQTIATYPLKVNRLF